MVRNPERAQSDEKVEQHSFIDVLKAGGTLYSMVGTDVREGSVSNKQRRSISSRCGGDSACLSVCTFLLSEHAKVNWRQRRCTRT